MDHRKTRQSAGDRGVASRSSVLIHQVTLCYLISSMVEEGAVSGR